MYKNVPKLWIFVFLAVTALVIAILATNPPEPESILKDDPVMEPVRSETFESMLEKGDNAIYIEDQQSGVSNIQVGFVVLANPGYIVVYNNNDGVPGNIIGTSDLLKTGSEHLIILLDEMLMEDQVYYAMLYHDDGDQRFRAEKDKQVVDAEDSVILMTFLANEASNPEKGPVIP